MHHGAALFQIGALVIDAPDTVLDVGELGLDVLRVEAIFVEDGARQVAEAMAGLAAFVAKTAEGHQEHGVAARPRGVAAAREQ
ncbi:hypothetical protein FQZ97_800700 [compost metagenome]